MAEQATADQMSMNQATEQATALRDGLWSVLRLQVPRILTQMERDPDSPWTGCFDRDFWHYKMRDFSSMILQQGLLVLDAARGLDLPGNLLHNAPAVEAWIEGGLRFWARAQRRSGGFDEYYPREDGYPPAAFSLYAVCLLVRRREAAPAPEVLAAMQRCADWLVAHPERKALNQEAAGLSALALAARIPGLRVDPDRLEQRLTEFFAAQSPEGWFPEYGGPDLGYLCVTIDCLWDYYTATGDERAFESMRRAARFISWMLAPGGRVPVMVNSRNTDYLTPYGLARLAASDAVASAVVRAMLERVREPDHYQHATDDRYSCHYLQSSHFRALAHLPEMTAPAPLPWELSGERVFPQAGIFVRHSDGESLFFAGHKGGVIYRIHTDGVAYADFGWRGRCRGKIAATHWQGEQWRMEVERRDQKTVVRTRGPVAVRGFFASTPLRHAVLRLLSFCFGNRLIPFLKEKMIFRGHGSALFFERCLRLENGYTLEDRISGGQAARLDWTAAPHASLRHVASAARFCAEELRPTPQRRLRPEAGEMHGVFEIK
ncbi:MAG: hypothetical protein AB7D47_11060 [Desulfovibrio sp.]